MQAYDIRGDGKIDLFGKLAELINTYGVNNKAVRRSPFKLLALSGSAFVEPIYITGENFTLAYDIAQNIAKRPPVEES